MVMNGQFPTGIRFLYPRILPPKPSLFYSNRVKIAYLLIDPRVETSLSISGGGRAAIPSIIISGPLVMRGLP